MRESRRPNKQNRVMFAGMRTLMYEERYVLDLGWGLRATLSKPVVGVQDKQDKTDIKEESRFPSTVPSGAISWCSNSASVPPLRRMSLDGVCVNVGTGRSPRLVCQSKPGSLLRVFLMMCVNVYFVASAECLLWGKGWG